MNQGTTRGIDIEAHYGRSHRYKPTSLELMSKVGLKAHKLPSKDGIFDVIFCESVFEGLRKSWVAVKGSHRVLKPDGFIYVMTAFLQQAHENHYFSMTEEGIESLMNRGVQPYQMPSYALAKFLSQCVRSILPYIYKSTKNGKVCDTNSYMSSPSKSSVSLVFMFAAFLKFPRFFGRFFKLDRVLAAGVYFLGVKE
jgi:ubiquinone/menaquinone biosynthesis C-methylase UbiE